MFEQVLVPNKNNSIIKLPVELYGLEVRIVAIPVKKLKPKSYAWVSDNSQTKNSVKIDNALKNIYNKKSKKMPHCIGLDMTGFKFNRDEANER